MRLWPHQTSLPKLPVPTLEETCATYLQSVQPHATPSELQRTKNSVAEFLQREGPVLQQRLLDYKAQQEAKGRSWLIDWWNDFAYMSYRDPVVFYVSYFFVFRDIPLPPSHRAASMILGALKFKAEIENVSLPPDTAKGPLCMRQYQFMFSTRIPEKPADTTVLSEGDYIVVMRKNGFYKVKVSGADYSSLVDSIEWIYRNADESVPVGLLTSENRDLWTDSRAKLIGIGSNKASVEAVENALFVLCLDEAKPVTTEEISRECWHGDGKNRFYDKSLQFILFDNGKAGFLGEHSMMDATPTSRLCEYVCEHVEKTRYDYSPSSSVAAPKKIEFNVTPSIEKMLERAQSTFDYLVKKHDVKVVEYMGFGKNKIKTFKVSPDAFAQMAIQLAYYKLYGRSVPTYESAQTKKYEWGRTETCRSVTNESAAWVKAMSDPNLSLQEKGNLGRKAIASQVAYMAKAVEGKGCDRHLLGLKMLLKPEEPIPALFSDPMYTRTKHWNLSTSQISSEYYTGYGWGQVVDDGYGIAYMIKNNSMHFNLASLHLQNDRLKHYFTEALEEMKAVFEATIPVSPKL